METSRISEEHRKVCHDMLDQMLNHLESHKGHRLICKIGIGSKEVPAGGMMVKRELNGEMSGVIAMVPEHQFPLIDGMADTFTKNLDTK